MPPDYVPPEHREKAFNCPHCGAFAHQRWEQAFLNDWQRGLVPVDWLEVAHCARCNQPSVWVKQDLSYPFLSTAPLPNPDMPAEVQADYLEASEIVGRSSRGAAALLRLAVQKLMTHLGEKGKNIDDDIAALVKKGLPVQIQQALDTVRVVGNESVHPGTIDLRDDPETAAALFGLLNVIVQDRITQPKQIAALYGKLPAGKLEGIRRRDEAST